MSCARTSPCSSYQGRQPSFMATCETPRPWQRRWTFSPVEAALLVQGRHHRDCDVEAAGQLLKHGQGRVANTAFEAGNVRPMKISAVRKLLLRKALTLAKGLQPGTKSSTDIHRQKRGGRRR